MNYEKIINALVVALIAYGAYSLWRDFEDHKHLFGYYDLVLVYPATENRPDSWQKLGLTYSECRDERRKYKQWLAKQHYDNEPLAETRKKQRRLRLECRKVK